MPSIVFAGMPGPLSWMTIDRPLTRDRYNWRNLGFFGGIERVVEQFLLHNQRPFVDVVAGLVDQFPAGAEFHQPRHR